MATAATAPAAAAPSPSSSADYLEQLAEQVATVANELLAATVAGGSGTASGEAGAVTPLAEALASVGVPGATVGPAQARRSHTPVLAHCSYTLHGRCPSAWLNVDQDLILDTLSALRHAASRLGCRYLRLGPQFLRRARSSGGSCSGAGPTRHGAPSPTAGATCVRNVGSADA